MQKLKSMLELNPDESNGRERCCRMGMTSDRKGSWENEISGLASMLGFSGEELNGQR